MARATPPPPIQWTARVRSAVGSGVYPAVDLAKINSPNGSVAISLAMGMRQPARNCRLVVDGQAVSEASPVTHVTADDPPFLLIHGDRDTTVPFSDPRSWKPPCARWCRCQTDSRGRCGARHWLSGMGQRQLVKPYVRMVETHLRQPAASRTLESRLTRARGRLHGGCLRGTSARAVVAVGRLLNTWRLLRTIPALQMFPRHRRRLFQVAKRSVDRAVLKPTM